jgi:hypothetical protein
VLLNRRAIRLQATPTKDEASYGSRSIQWPVSLHYVGGFFSGQQVAGMCHASAIGARGININKAKASNLPLPTDHCWDATRLQVQSDVDEGTVGAFW